MNRCVDNNQAEIVKALRKAGYVVTDMTYQGRGFPDLLLTDAEGNIFLVEVKNLKGRGVIFTPAQKKWFSNNKCKIYIATEPEQILSELRQA